MERLPKSEFFDSLSKLNQAREIPEHVLFELTYGCNFRCVHCLNPTHRALPQELKTEEIFRILEEIADLGVLSVYFSGGELFTRPDTFAVLKKAKTLGFLIDILSNASRIAESDARALEAVGIDDLGLSIYGATPETYERVTGAPGSFNRFLNGLEALSKTELKVTVRMAVLTLNDHEVLEAQRLVESYGFKFRFSFDIQPRQDGDLTPYQYRLTPEKKMDIAQKMNHAVSFTAMNDEEPCPETMRFIDCDCGRSKFAVTPYGEMNLCVAFPYPKYDLRTGSVREGWELLKRIVREARPNEHYECPSCEFRQYCRQGRNDAWLETGDMSACLPHFKEWAVLEKKFHGSRETRSAH